MMASSPSVATRVTQIVFAVFYCLTCSGIIFGFAAAKPIFIQEGVYAELCADGERRRSPVDGKWMVCEFQDIRLNLIFTVAAVATSVAGFPSGYALDNLGPRTTSILGALLMVCGAGLFGLEYQSSLFDSYLVGYFLIALGGPLVCLSSFHLSNAFPAHAGLILSTMTGSFDASSLPFVVWQTIYRRTDGALGIRKFFFLYLIIPATLVVEQVLIAPAKTYQRAAPVAFEAESSSETDPLLPSSSAAVSENLAASLIASGFSHIHLGDNVGDNEGMVKTHGQRDRLTGALYGRSALEQIKSKWFFFLTAFVCVHMTRINFYILSIDAQLEKFTGSHASAEDLTTLFTIMLPVGGIAGIPFVGLLIDRLPFFYVMLVTLVFGLGMGLLGLTPSPTLQVAGFAFFVVFRPLLYTSVSEAVAKIFGFETFGTLYGLAMTIAGFVALANVPLDVLVKTKLKSYVLVDCAFILLGALSTGALLYLIWQKTRVSTS